MGLGQAKLCLLDNATGTGIGIFSSRYTHRQRSTLAKVTVCLPKFSKSFEMESIVVPIPIFEIHSVTSRQTKYAFREARNRRYVGQRIEAGTSGIRVGVEHIRELPRDRVVGAEDGHWFHNCQYFYVQ